MSGRQDAERRANIFRVLETIRRLEPVSRADVGELTGLAAGTVSEAVAELELQGFVVNEVVPRKGRGRPLSVLRVEPDALLLAGASIGIGELQLVIADARGDVRFSRSAAFQADRSRPMIEALASALREALAAAPPRFRRIDALGLALSGTIDTHRGLLHWGRRSVDPPVPVAALLSSQLGRPVFVENLVLARARAERLYGDGRDVDDFAVVDHTLGLGQYVKGELWTGPRGLNPEFRHFKIGLEPGLRCDCGAFGCLGTYTGILGMMRQGCAIVGEELPPFRDAEPKLNEFVERARGGDERFQFVFEQAGRVLGVALANVVNFHDPDRIIVLGPNPGVLEAIESALRGAMSANLFPPGRIVDLRLKSEREPSYAEGAVALAFERFMSSGLSPGRHLR